MSSSEIKHLSRSFDKLLLGYLPCLLLNCMSYLHIFGINPLQIISFANVSPTMYVAFSFCCLFSLLCRTCQCGMASLGYSCFPCIRFQTSFHKLIAKSNIKMLSPNFSLRFHCPRLRMACVDSLCWLWLRQGSASVQTMTFHLPVVTTGQAGRRHSLLPWIRQFSTLTNLWLCLWVPTI